MRKWRSQAQLRSRDGGRPTSRDEWRAFLGSIAERVENDTFDFSGISRKRRNGKWLVWTPILEEVLVLLKINDNIRRSYGIRQQNRSALIRTAKQAFSESTPKTVARIDIKNCFESIERESLLRSMRSEGKVSAQTIVLLDWVFRRANIALRSRRTGGIPRGLNVSTSLAEIALSRLDTLIRQIPGTYLVLRYVDDILVFSTSDELALMRKLKEATSSVGLKLNQSKSKSLRIACDCDTRCQHNGACPCSKSCTCQERGNEKQLEVEFLGYKFVFSNRNAAKQRPNPLICVFSDKKISRTKTRIALAIRDFLNTKNLDLLVDRMRFLADNQALGETPSRKGLYSGNSYSYSEYLSDPDFKGPGRIEDVDNFYRTQVRRLEGSYGASLSSLHRISFRSGLLHRRRTKFPALRVMEITKCWGAS
jgi:hypothetical protein